MTKECLKKIKKAIIEIDKRNKRLKIENNKCYGEEEEELMDIIDDCDESLPGSIKELFEMCAKFDNFIEDVNEVCLNYYRNIPEEDKLLFIEYITMRLRYWEPFKKRELIKDFYQICTNYLNYFEHKELTL